MTEATREKLGEIRAEANAAIADLQAAVIQFDALIPGHLDAAAEARRIAIALEQVRFASGRIFEVSAGLLEVKGKAGDA